MERSELLRGLLFRARYEGVCDTSLRSDIDQMLFGDTPQQLPWGESPGLDHLTSYERAALSGEAVWLSQRDKDISLDMLWARMCEAAGARDVSAVSALLGSITRAEGFQVGPGR